MNPDNNSDHPNVITKPPFIYLGFLVLGFIADAFWPAGWISNGGRMIGVVLCVAGIAIIAAAFRLFKKAGTNVNPYEPVTAIVTQGIYRFTRNPMYVGLTLLYTGIGIASDNPWMLGFLIPILFLMHYGVIFREEAYLEKKFGQPYGAYKKSVRRWF